LHSIIAPAKASKSAIYKHSLFLVYYTSELPYSPVWAMVMLPYRRVIVYTYKGQFTRSIQKFAFKNLISCLASQA
jgi:hypothetical protein